MPSFLLAALHYALEIRRPIFPIVPRGKDPITQRGFLVATREEKTIRAWWGRNPEANIGLPCGRGILCLDIDGTAGAQSLRQLEKTNGALPPTVESKTARGRHLFFGVREKLRPSAGQLGEGLDIRADGSYVVVPPSVHPSGKTYRWRRGRAPGEHTLAPAPTWLLKLVRPTNKTKKVKKRDRPRGSQGGLQGESKEGSQEKTESGRVWCPPRTEGSFFGVAFEAAGMAGPVMRSGALVVDCPWGKAHTGDDGLSSTVVLPPTSANKWGLFHCSHGHCGKRRTLDLLDVLPIAALAVAREKCGIGLVRATITQAILEGRPATPTQPPLARWRLDLATSDGEVLPRADVVLPTQGNEQAREIFRAVFPGLRWAAALTRIAAWKERGLFPMRGKRLDVVVKGDRITWMRAAPPVLVGLPANPT